QRQIRTSQVRDAATGPATISIEAEKALDSGLKPMGATARRSGTSPAAAALKSAPIERTAEESVMVRIVNRRQAIAFGVGACGASLLGGSAAFADNGAEELIRAFAKGATPAEGRIKLELPEIAENGNTVPMTLSVESPMTEQSYVAAVLVVANANPRPGV